MKRGYLLIIFLSCIIILLANVGFVSAQAVDCQIRAVCQSGWSNIAKVSADGHFSSNMAGSEPFTLCCRDVDTTSGIISFNYSNEGHVSFKSLLTSFPNGFKLGFQDTCRLTSGNCLNNIGEMCIFRVTESAPGVADNSHIAECGSGSLGVNLCCRRTEVCSNGIDDDADTYIDCADEDCHVSATTSAPQECTGSPYNSSTCVQLDRSVSPPVITNNSDCYYPKIPPQQLYYCSYPLDGSLQGACCPSGKVAQRDGFGNWQCVDYAECGLKSVNPLYPCGYDFDSSTNSWITTPYDGDVNDWCVSRLPDLYNPDGPIYDRSTGCCLMVKNGIVDYYTDDGNVKIFGTS
jgi:hypothetical protein